MPEVSRPEDEGRRPEVPSATRDYVLRVYPAESEGEVRISDLWRAVLRGKWLVLCAMCSGILLGVALAFVVPRTYRAEVVLAPVSADSSGQGMASLARQLSGVAAIAGIDLGGNNNVAESMATLRSRAFTEEFIRERNLLPVLFSEIWDETTQTWTVDDEDDIPTMWDAYKRFDSIRGISEDAKTGLVTLTISWKDPQIAATWANELVRDVNEALRRRAIRESRRNLEFLQNELEASSAVEVRNAVFRLIEAEMKNAMLANVKEEYAFKIIDPAVVPEDHYWPKLGLLIVLGGAGGLIVGVLVAVARRPGPA